jgi:hypothetical protein
MSAPAPPPDRPLFDQALPDGRRLSLFIREKSFKPAVGRMDQVVDYVLRDAAGRELARSPERMTYYMADPTPLAEAAGLWLDGAPCPLGEVGDVWIFRKR